MLPAAICASCRARFLLFAVLLLGSSSASPGQGTEQPSQIRPLGPPGVPAQFFPLPHRPVAGIVAEEWATEETRDRDGEAEQIMNFLGVGPGMTVADLGAGAGYYTVRLAKRVGPVGRVLAEDVVPAYLAKLQERVSREHLDNVTLVLGEPHDPRLPFRSVDLVLMVHMYHEVAQPYGLLFNLLPALRPGRASPSSILISQRSCTAHPGRFCSASSIGLASGKRIGAGCAARVNISLSLSRRHSRQSMRLYHAVLAI